VHYWGVWHEEAPFSTYKWAVPRFMSEYGFQSFPLLDSVRRYAEPEDWSIESPVMQLHQKHPRGNGIIRKYLLQHYREPKDFETFLYLSQLLQAEGIRMAIEAHRKAKPFCMGTLYWQLNDCWPVASWAGIDYYGQWKALHYAVRQAFSPLLVVLETEEEDWSATVVSDEPEDKRLRLSMGLYRLTGERLWLEEKSLKVPANGKALVGLEDLKTAAEGYDAADLWIRVQLADAEAAVYDHTAYLVPARDLHLPVPKVKVSTEANGAQLTVTLQSNVLVMGLYLSLEGLPGNFTDNFFDLCPGEPKTVHLTLPEPPEKGWPAVRLLSVYDSYTE
jgi:beta-mannosidase